jgi:hypothetical protein
VFSDLDEQVVAKPRGVKALKGARGTSEPLFPSAPDEDLDELEEPPPKRRKLPVCFSPFDLTAW